MTTIQGRLKDSLPTILLLLLVLFFSSFILLWRLGENHLIEFDEAIYAVIAKNIVKSGDFLRLTLRGDVPWLDKPPLYFWLSALSIKLLGPGALAVQLPSALFGLGTTILTYLFGKTLFGKRVGFIAAMVLASTVGFLYYSRLGMVDSTLTFFMLGTIFFFWLGRSSPKFFLTMGLFLGFGLMTKNLIAFLSLLSIFVFILLDTKDVRQRYVNKMFFYGLIVAAAIALPWHLYMLAVYKKTFWDVYFVYHSFSRINKVIEDESAPLFWYLKVIRTQFRIWYLFLYPTIFWSLGMALKKDRRVLLLLTQSLVIFTVFTLSASKLIWFILPVYPTLALLTAVFLEKLFKMSFGEKRLFILPVLIFSLAAFYTFRKIDKIIPPDFSRDLVRGVLASDKINPEKSIIVLSGDFYTASFYNDGGTVLSISAKELKMVARDFEPVFILIPNRLREKELGLAGQLKKVGEFDSYVLLEKGQERETRN